MTLQLNLSFAVYTLYRNLFIYLNILLLHILNFLRNILNFFFHKFLIKLFKWFVIILFREIIFHYFLFNLLNWFFYRFIIILLKWRSNCIMSKLISSFKFRFNKSRIITKIRSIILIWLLGLWQFKDILNSFWCIIWILFSWNQHSLIFIYEWSYITYIKVFFHSRGECNLFHILFLLNWFICSTLSCFILYIRII